MTLKTLFNSKLLENIYTSSPVAIERARTGFRHQRDIENEFTLVDDARRDARGVKFAFGALAAICITGAILADQNDHRIALSAASGLFVCIANDHRRYQKQHAKELESPPLHAIACKRANWHLME